MAVEIATASSYLDLMDRFRRFITGRGKLLANTYTGTGNGVMSNLLFAPAAVTETWTITCTAAAPNAGTFSVVGSVSGAQADLTVGVQYSNAFIESVLIADGTVNFVVGDKWVLSVEQGVMTGEGQAWFEEAWVPSYASSSVAEDRMFFIRGPGLAGQDAIHVQLYTHRNEVSDWYNWRINGAAGFNPDASPLYGGQPGYDGGSVTAMMLWNQTLPYWFIANGRRFIIVAKISTVYQSCYGGFILPYGLPSEYPYPLAIGGSFNGNARWSNDSPDHLNWTNPNSTLRLRQPDGNWLTFENYYNSGNTAARRTSHNVWPTAAMNNPRPSIDGAYSLNPLVLHSSGQGGNVYGEFQGVRRVSGYANASENTQQVGDSTWLVVQDGFRTGVDNYFAIELE